MRNPGSVEGPPGQTVKIQEENIRGYSTCDPTHGWEADLLSFKCFCVYDFNDLPNTLIR